jgi:hypothetical protein
VIERNSFRGANDIVSFSAAKRRKRIRSWLPFIPLWGAAALAGTAYGAGWLDGLSQRHFAASPSASGVRAHFSLCFIGGGYNCVVDGDTI